MEFRIDAELTKRIVAYVDKHVGCTGEEIKKAIQQDSFLDEVLDALSECGPNEDGSILKKENGKYFIGSRAEDIAI